MTSNLTGQLGLSLPFAFCQYIIIILKTQEDTFIFLALRNLNIKIKEEYIKLQS